MSRPTSIDRVRASEARKRGDKRGLTALVQMRWRLARWRDRALLREKYGIK